MTTACIAGRPAGRGALARRGLVAATWAGLVLATGCVSVEPGTRRVLGPADYDKAFSVSRRVLKQHFSLAESDRGRGILRSRPQWIEPSRRLLRPRVPARQIATFRIRPDEPYVVVQLSIALEYPTSDAERFVQQEQENYSGAANRTPGQLEAATTPRQNASWRKVRYDHALERAILEELAEALRLLRTSQPAASATSRPQSEK